MAKLDLLQAAAYADAVKLAAALVPLITSDQLREAAYKLPDQCASAAVLLALAQALDAGDPSPVVHFGSVAWAQLEREGSRTVIGGLMPGAQLRESKLIEPDAVVYLAPQKPYFLSPRGDGGG